MFNINYIIYTKNDYDLTVVGQIKFNGSLTRLPIGIIDCLKNDLKINFIATPGSYDFTDVPDKVKKIVKNPDKTPGKVSLFIDMLWHINSVSIYYVPNSIIKIAYSMLESTAIPNQWVTILNNKFDLVVVPDNFYKVIYTECGVTIPIFVVPCGFYMEELFNQPLKSKVNIPFAFGISASFTPQKNYEVLIDAFAQEFGNNSNVILKLHGYAGAHYNIIKHRLKKYNLKNIVMINRPLSRHEYLQFLLSLDCYVLLSKGEGFSLTPREALALGIPCIITNNTAHKTICDTEYVYSVPSNKIELAYYRCFGGHCGNNFSCTIADAAKALKEVYINYRLYLDKAHNGRQWVERYLYKNLKAEYLTLIKPQKVILANENKIEKGILTTNSKTLYKKYLTISSNK